MEKRLQRPVLIRFKSHKEAVDLYYSIEMKYFMLRLLYTHYTHRV